MYFAKVMYWEDMCPRYIWASPKYRSILEPFRAAVLMRDVEGLTLKEMAEIMRCPIGTVKSRLQRGRYELRRKLAPFVEDARFLADLNATVDP